MTDTISDTEGSQPEGPGRLWLAFGFGVFLAAIAAGGLWWSGLERDEGNRSGQAAVASSATQWSDESQCQQCHQAQFQDWQGSHHQLAMLLPSDTTVRGDFNNATFRSDVETTEFFRRGKDFWVRTPGAGGESNEFRVAYTFGWEPLQQYLVALDDDRLQALGTAWDTDREQWFHLYDGQGVDASHPLHWDQPAHNANTQCIDCHTTGFQTGYDASSNRFDSQWQSLGVGCQACHGPAVNHVSWAHATDQGSLANEPFKGFAQSLQRDSGQLETCGRCHSRRTPLGAPSPGMPLEDAFLISSLTAALYEVDGKILGEVFEHGSFLQSAMHKSGVVCSDCHNPHSGQLRAEGNAVCSQCHNPVGQASRVDVFAGGLRAFDYSSPAHHQHEAGSPGALCRNCHMPGKLYMGNDLRHDHSFSSPDPVQALALGHSDACLSCHADKPGEALAASFQQWYPDHQPRDGGYAKALHSARQGLADAARLVFEQLDRDDLPAARRAALLAELPQYPSHSAEGYSLKDLDHTDAGVRRAAIETASSLLDLRTFQEQLSTLLSDEVRSVRLAATEQLLMLADQYGQTLPADLFEEYEQVQLELLANAEAHFNLARLYQWTGRSDQVEASLQKAIERNPAFSPASIALAQWFDGRAADTGLNLLEERLRHYPNDPDLHHAMGLANIRAGNIAVGVRALEQANALAPENDQYAYVLAVAWYDTAGGDAHQGERALNLLRNQLQLHPANRSLRLTLLAYVGAESEEGKKLLDELRQQNPGDPALPPSPSFGAR